MKKMELYAGIMLLLVLLNGCKGQENEIIQDNIETETENYEEIQDNAYTVSASEISCAVKEGKREENEVVWNAENASVKDSDFTITLGMLFKDFEYYGEESPTVIVDNCVGNVYAYGAWHDVYFHPYTDLTVYTSDYNPVTHDMSGEDKYIVQIDIDTSRFCTSRGITAGTSLDELREAYRNENLVEVDRDVADRYRYVYKEGYICTSFYMDMEQQQVRRISLALVLK